MVERYFALGSFFALWKNRWLMFATFSLVSVSVLGVLPVCGAHLVAWGMVSGLGVDRSFKPELTNQAMLALSTGMGLIFAFTTAEIYAQRTEARRRRVDLRAMLKPMGYSFAHGALGLWIAFAASGVVFFQLGKTYPASFPWSSSLFPAFFGDSVLNDFARVVVLVNLACFSVIVTMFESPRLFLATSSKNYGRAMKQEWRFIQRHVRRGVFIDGSTWLLASGFYGILLSQMPNCLMLCMLSLSAVLGCAYFPLLVIRRGELHCENVSLAAHHEGSLV